EAVGSGLRQMAVPAGFRWSGLAWDIASAHGVLKEPAQALLRVLRPVPRRVGTAGLVGRAMISASGVGFDGQVAKTVNASKWKERLGKGSYALGVIQELHRFQPTRVTLEVDGQVLQEKDGWLIAIANISCYGRGMK